MYAAQQYLGEYVSHAPVTECLVKGEQLLGQSPTIPGDIGQTRVLGHSHSVFWGKVCLSV